MLEEAKTFQSPAWWLKTLGAELMDRRAGRDGGKRWKRGLSTPARVRPGIDLLNDHLRGDPPLLGMADGWEEHFRVVAQLGRLNVAELAVLAKADRINLRGFRTSVADDELGDQKAADLMRATGLRVAMHEAVTEALAFRRGYLMVTPPQRGSEIPVVTDESAQEVITAHDPATRETLASLKLFRDEWGDADVAHLYIRQKDGSVEHHQARREGRATSITPESGFRLNKSWKWVGDGPKKLARMPLVAIRTYRDTGVFEAHLDTLDRINDQIMDKLVIAKVQAFRQLAIKGLPDTEKKIVDGKVTEVEIDYGDAFIAAPGAAWQVPEGVDFWESQITDMRPLLEGIKDDLEHFAAVTRTPLHMITPDAASGSAEGASLMREGHVSAIERCLDYMSLGAVEAMSTMFAFAGDEARADISKLEALWAPVERFGLAERADAASKAKDSLPREAIQRDIWQYDPAEIPNLRTLGGRDLLGQINGTPSGTPTTAPAFPTFQSPALPAPVNGQTSDAPAAP